LDANPTHAVVCGRRREHAPEATVYNRLADMEWNTPPGPAAACGGDAMMRRDALAAVGGFREDLIAGEEPELCLRLTRAGWQIERLDAEMTGHDAGLDRFGQWWRRTVRSGWAAAEGAALHGRGAERYNVARLRSIILWGAAIPGGTLFAGGLALAMAGAAAGLLAAVVVGGLAMIAIQTKRITRGRQRDRGDTAADARLYAVFTMLGKLAQVQGVLRYALTAARGGRARLIEYRSET
ncbi:MAG: glycosyltransferase family 2 protein, partial [Pseudomonadota bacterium]